MKNGAIFTIFKKEVFRFMKDKRTLVALLLPGLLIYSLYSIMGGALSNAFAPTEDYKTSIVAVNLPVSVGSMLTDDTFVVTTVSEAEIDTVKQQITNSEKDVLMVFPENFDEQVALYSPLNGEAAPNIDIFYNSTSTNSTTGYTSITSLLSFYESAMTNKFDVNMGGSTYDLASKEDMTGKIFSMMMPMLLVMLLFSGCMAVAPESIAGEKERGTVATMLITPAKRSHIAIGKILALSLMAIISGASSTVGVILSLPKLMGEEVELNGSVYGVSDYLMLAVVILSTVMLFITAISIISAYAKTIKEATTYVTPLMIISMLISLSGMMGSATGNPVLYLIPIFNSVHSMIGIFSFDASIVNMAITVGANLALTGVGIFALTRMFDNEKIMFNK